MTSSESKIGLFILHSIVPVLSSCIAGFLIYQDVIFNRQHFAFQFVWSATVASMFYHLLMTVKPREAYAGLFVLLFLTLLMADSARPAFILRDIFYIGGIGVTIALYVKHFKAASSKNPFHAAITLAGLYGVVNFIVSTAHVGIMVSLNIWTLGESYATYGLHLAGFLGLLIGFSVGAGIALGDRLLGRIDHE